MSPVPALRRGTVCFSGLPWFPRRFIRRHPRFRGTVRFVDGGERVLVDGDFITNDKQVHHIHVKLECYQVPGIWFGQNLEKEGNKPTE